MEWTIRPCTEADVPSFYDLDNWAFPGSPSPEAFAGLPFIAPPEEMRLAETSAGQPVGMYGAFPFDEFPVPGGTVACGGLTWVGVHPGFRRRGILTAMMARHFDECREQGRAISALHAAEPAIYGRFGYGLASKRLSLTIPRGAAWRDVPGQEEVSIDIVRASEADLGEMVRLHRAVARPGWVSRTRPEQQPWLIATPHGTGGAEKPAIAWASRGGRPTGYALFQRKESWSETAADGTLTVKELAATDPASRAALWRTLSDLDLMARTEVAGLPVDDPVCELLADVQAASPRYRAGLWVRIIDVAAALAARRYVRPVDAVIEVSDPRIGANNARFRIEARADGDVTVTRTKDAPAIGLSVRELGAIYLGGTSLGALIDAGLADPHDPPKASALATAFSWTRSPASSWIF